MTIDEAIRRTRMLKEAPILRDFPKVMETLEFNIEALKTIKAERTIYGFKRQVRLPGETEE